jgi:CheY-like chemotaxis protein
MRCPAGRRGRLAATWLWNGSERARRRSRAAARGTAVRPSAGRAPAPRRARRAGLGGAPGTRPAALISPRLDLPRKTILVAAGARSVEEALWFLRGIRVHLVLLDLRAGDAAGLEPIGRVRADRASWGLPLVALTLDSWPCSEQSARLASCAAVLVDPTPEVLVEAIRGVLNDPAIRR